MRRKSAKTVAVIEPDRSQRCHTCGRAIAGFESVHYGSIERGYRDLCNRCFNLEVAETGEINFSHVQFEPLDLPDAAGVAHRFHFEVRLLGDKVSLEAFELVDGDPGGYEFQVLGDAEDDLCPDGPDGSADPPIARTAAPEDRARHAWITHRRFDGPWADHLG